MSTLSEAGTHNLAYFIQFATFFTSDTFLEIGVRQRISGRLMSESGLLHLGFLFGFFFIRDNCWSNVMINFIDCPNCRIGGLSEFAPLFGSSFNFALVEEQEFDLLYMRLESSSAFISNVSSR